MKTLPIGKYRGLQQCATSSGALAILALDHRNNLRDALHPEAPDSVTLQELSAFKRQVTGALAPYASAVLLDPEVGAFQNLSTIPGTVGLVVALEATGFLGDPQARQSKLLPNWNPAKAKRLGANAIKLLVYYHPDAPTASAIEVLVQQVGSACHDIEIPFMLEPISYPLAPGQKKLKGEELRRVVVETARRLTPLGVDVLKTDFPLDIAANRNVTDWADACAELSSASLTPWVLLSASVTFDTYLREVTIACQEGASGVAAGRAVWREATVLSDSERTEFLAGPAAVRLQRLTALVSALAKPWYAFYETPHISPNSFQVY